MILACRVVLAWGPGVEDWRDLKAQVTMWIGMGVRGAGLEGRREGRCQAMCRWLMGLRDWVP